MTAATADRTVRQPTAEPLVPLPGTSWHVWRSAVLRGCGFAATGLNRLAAPDCAALADRYLAARCDAGEFQAGFASALSAMTAQLGDIAGDPLFRAAVTWQSPTSVEALDGLLRAGLEAPRRSRQREREIAVTRYWQRYCGKNDTIGFFGPVGWLSFDPDGPALRAVPGDGLLRARVVDFEWRALSAFAHRICADHRYRSLRPVVCQPHLHLAGDRLSGTGAPPRPLGPAQRALLAACPVPRPAGDVVDEVLRSPTAGLRRAEDGYLLLEQLAADGVVRWGLDLPFTVHAEAALREWLAALPDPELRAEAGALFTRLSAARDAVAAAAGDADALRPALRRLDADVAELTRAPTTHRPGATYAGRGVVYEDTARDLTVTLGGPVLSALAAPLALLGRAARWLSAAVADGYLAAVRELYDEAVADLGRPEVPMGELWYLVNGVMFSDGPGRLVLADFVARWSDLLGLDRVAPDEGRVTRSAAELAARVEEVFPAAAPGWPAARLHSPDLQLCADGPAALARGEFTAVLGELHVAWLTADSGTFVRFHPDPGALRAAAVRDLGRRTVLLYPPDFPELTARITEGLLGPDDLRIGYTAAPVWPGIRVLPLGALTVSDVDGELLATGPDGQRWSLRELFGPFLSALAVNAFKLVPTARHTPRVSIDRLVVQRETWRTTVGETGLVGVRGEAECYLAARRFRAGLGLPERVFVRVDTEVKPVYVDFTSPAYVAALCAMLRAAARSRPDTGVMVSELLPGPEQTWLSDVDGQRYQCELRVTLRDPVPAGSGR